MKNLYLYFAGLGRLDFLPKIFKWTIFSLSLTLVIPMVRWQTFMRSLTK